MKLMLIKVGWPKQFVEKRVPVIPISGWCGDNLLEKSKNMAWWEGQKVKISKEKGCHLTTLKEALDIFVQPAKRDLELNMRLPLSGVYKIKGVGDVLTGRVEQGAVHPGDEVKFLPTHSASTACTGKVFTVEMHHKNVDAAMQRVGDVMVKSDDDSIHRTKSFTAQVQVLNHPGELKVGYCPIAFIRTGRSAVRLSELKWKVGKETGGQKAEGPISIKAGEMGAVSFE